MTEHNPQTTRPYKSAALILLGSFLVLFFLISSVSLSRLEMESKQQIQSTLLSRIQNTHDSLNIWLNDRMQTLAMVVQGKELISLVEAQLQLSNNPVQLKSSYALNQLRDLFTPWVSNSQNQGVEIISPDYINIVSMQNSSIGALNVLSRQKRNILQRAFAGEAQFIAAIKIDALPAQFLLSPIRNNKQRVIAVLALKLAPQETFTQIIQQGNSGKSGESYALNNKGQFISESRFTEQLHQAGALATFQITTQRSRITTPGANLLTGEQSSQSPENQPLTLLAREASQGRNGINMDGYKGYLGVDVYGAWLWDDKWHYALATEIQVEEALQSYSAIKTIVISALSLILVLLLTLAGTVLLLDRKRGRSQLELNHQLELRVKERTLALEEVKVRLSSATKELQELATIDSLTGLSNRRNLELFLEREWNRCMRDKKSVSLIRFDIDYFKQYNDNYGHLAGDECLQRIGQLLQSERIISRPGDLIARYGGEEFAIVLSETDKESALHIINKLMAVIEDESVPHRGTLVNKSKIITISAGLATIVPCQQINPLDLIELADEALHKAKSKGRNQYQIATTQEHLEQQAG